MIRSIFALGKNFKDEIGKRAGLILQQGQNLVGMKCFQAKEWLEIIDEGNFYSLLHPRFLNKICLSQNFNVR